MSAGISVYESNYRSGLRVLDASEIAQGALRELGFFDIYPVDDNPEFQRRMDLVSVLLQRRGDRERHRAGTVRRPAARDSTGAADRTRRDTERTRHRGVRRGTRLGHSRDQSRARPPLGNPRVGDAAVRRRTPVGSHVAGRLLAELDRDLRTGQPGPRL